MNCRTRRRGLLVATLLAGGLATLLLVLRYASRDAGSVRVDVQELGRFPLHPRRDGDEAIPSAVRRLDGRKVVVIGEMYAPDQPSSRVSHFQLVRDVEARAVPRVQQRVFATVSADKTIRNYTGRQVEASGTLSVGIQRLADGTAISLYRMQVDRVTQVRDPAAASSLRSDPIAASVCALMAGLVLGGVGWGLWAARRRDAPVTAPLPGRCARCGYDLRASVERCPECGSFFGRGGTT